MVDDLLTRRDRIGIKGFKAILLSCVLILAFVFSLQYLGGRADKIDNSIFGESSAKVETWTEQSFIDWFFGNGFFQTRTMYTATPNQANTSRVYRNTKLIATLENGSSVNQEYTHSRTDRFGHSVSASVKGKSARFEAAVEYSFNYETATTKTVKVVVPARRLMDVYQSDVQVKNHYVNVKKQRQTASWTGWKDTGSASYSGETILEYSGCRIQYIEFVM